MQESLHFTTGHGSYSRKSRYQIADPELQEGTLP